MTIKNIDPNPKTTVTNTTEDPLETQETLDTIVGTITPGTVRSANANWFASAQSFSDELAANRAAPCIVSFIFSGNDAKISFTHDGTKFGELFEGTTLKANAEYEIPIQAEEDSAFNLRASEDVTIERCVVTIKGKQA